MFEEKATLISPDRPPIYDNVVCSQLYSLKKWNTLIYFSIPSEVLHVLWKGTFLPRSAKFQAPGRQQMRLRTSAKKRVHHELSSSWFNLPPQPPTCVELKHLAACFLLSTRDLCMTKLKTQRQDSKEHEEEMTLHRAAQGKHWTQICRKYARLVLPVVAENL